MIIPIDETCRIATDSRQWMVQVKRLLRKEPEEFIWKPISYHPNLEQAVLSLHQRRVRALDAETLREVLLEAENVLVTLTDALTPILDGEGAYPIQDGQEVPR